MSPAAGIRLVVNFPSSSFRASWLQKPAFNKVQLCLWNGRPKQQVRGLEGMMDWIQWGRKLGDIFRPKWVQTSLNVIIRMAKLQRHVFMWHRLGHREWDREFDKLHLSLIIINRNQKRNIFVKWNKSYHNWEKYIYIYFQDTRTH